MSQVELSLYPVGLDGAVGAFRGKLPSELLEPLAQTTSLYNRIGFQEPWISYVGVSGRAAMGMCAFKAPPAEGRVEIAYYTLPAHEGQGLATAMAARLVEITRLHDSSLTIIAQTLPARGASHRILEKLGFRHVADVNHPEDGLVWEWHLPSS